MRLTTKGRYAVLALVDIAANCCGRPITLAEIAERQDISLSYLEQLFCKLRKRGLVQSARGPGGGYRLARAPEQTRIADIVLAVDEPMLGCGDVADPARPAHPTDVLWLALGREIERFLGSVSLADLLDGSLHEEKPRERGAAGR
jgi:Rrf2 family iron-sulfur cluster assembly transcriptional regulator